ncbi:helix-turn-helix transcriptional regulator [Streptomyces sp. NBC_00654]|uniref:helix-turn-helix domain-containing protein n=1 Tax=Streptomyces sp. NBC_00654 TaxID=2975799 RepID=UPI00224EB84E|nr:helix-turn-helix transcriptional regulator [Streptomyces sp. NBC_00654]MCX4969851.1 helix-turn-helix transcriptional regulator [Streptomyces sp. NBC_00654]
MVNRKELNPESGPVAAFGARVRKFREDRGWSQEDLAERTGYSSQHISAVETGRKPPTLPFSRRVDHAFGAAGSADSFEREWRDIRHGSLLEGFQEYVGYEGRAAEIRLYEVGVIPGLLQTPEYAAAIEAGHVERGAITTEQAQERVSLLAERQAALVRSPPPLVHMVLDESCILRPVGEPCVIQAQLKRLAEFAEQPNATLQVANFAMGVRRPFSLPITILTLSDRSLMSYAESATQGHLDRETTSVLPLLTAYHQLQKHALPQVDSVAMITQVRRGTS